MRRQLGEARTVERDVQRPVAPEARIDAGPFAKLRDEFGIDRERLAAQREHRGVRHLLAERREHPGARPRRCARRLGPVVHGHRGAALGEFVRDAEPDQPGADDENVRRGYIPV